MDPFCVSETRRIYEAVDHVRPWIFDVVARDLRCDGHFLVLLVLDDDFITEGALHVDFSHIIHNSVEEGRLATACRPEDHYCLRSYLIQLMDFITILEYLEPVFFLYEFAASNG